MTTTIGPENPAFVGFIASSERPHPTESYFSCPSSYQFAVSATFNGCCPSATADCLIATTCVYGTLSFAESTSLCQSGSCQSQLLVPATSGPTTTAYFCGNSIKSGHTLYRTEHITTRTSVPSPSATLASSGRTTTTTTTTTSLSSTYGPAPGTPPPPTVSRTWIAGAVLGALVFIAILSTSVYLLLSRRRRRRADAASAPDGGVKSVEFSSQEDMMAFYYNQDMKFDPRASKGPWSPYSSGYESLRRGNEEGRLDGQHELAGDRSTQVYIELPGLSYPRPVELPAESIKNDERLH